MQIPVRRVTYNEYKKIINDQLKSKTEPVWIDIPSSSKINAAFRGVFYLPTEVVVPWPIDRTPEAQQKFAEENHCGFPSTTVTVKTHLKLVKDDDNVAME